MMTEPTTDELDQAEGREISATIGKLLGRKVIFPFPDKPTSYLDWNALMAAVAVLEKDNYVFTRTRHGRNKRAWHVVYKNPSRPAGEYPRFICEEIVSESEPDAVARCIRAVSDD